MKEKDAKDIKPGDIEIKEQKLSNQDEREKELEIPRFMSRLELKHEDRDRIVKEITDELDELDQERKEFDLEGKCDALDDQYDGKLQKNEDEPFNLHRQTTKIKIDAIVRSAKEAFFESDPKFSISPRPEFDKRGGEDVAEKQEDFLDYKIEEVVPLESAMEKVFHSGALKFGGVLKLFWETRREYKRREETYEGKPEPVLDPQTKQQLIDPQTKQPVFRNKGLEDFLTNYPDAAAKYPGTVKKLAAGQTVNIVARYRETTYNDPMPRHVDLKDFYVRRSCEGYLGLCQSRFHAERHEFSYWDLKKLEESNEHFYGVDELTYLDDKDGDGERKRIDRYESKQYEVFECVYWTKLKEDDDEETRCVFWISREKKKMVGSLLYPFYDIDSYYIPFYVKNKKKGFYQDGVGEDLRDSNMAEDIILNHILKGFLITNTLTPIVEEGSAVEEQFLEKRWQHGVPINAKPGEIDFLNKYMKPMEAGSGIQLIQYLIQGDDAVSGVSSLMTGKESPIDPTAPATKTLALLEQSGINIKGYVRTLLPSFNLVPEIMLKMYHQMSREGIRYRVRQTSEAVVGEDPFGVINRAELKAKTAIQSQALAFNFSKSNEKREDLALFSTLRNEPLIARNPAAVYELLKAIVKGWSPKWKHRLDKVLPTFEDFQTTMQQAAVQAVAVYVREVLKNAEVTKTPPKFNPGELLAVMQDFIAETATPPSEEAVKARGGRA